ncbi:hypothetical protein Tco_0186003 [Tanacetum coccineum]
MAKGTVPAPTRTDDQLVPVKARLPIGKRNLLMGLQRKQKNPIFLISLYILQNTNFFDAFTTSANFPSVYIQQFLNTLTMDTMSGIYSFQLDELWFTLVVDLLRNALGITPKDPAHPFVAPPAVDLVIDFVFGVSIPKDLLTDAIRNAEYYQKYLEIAARKPRQPTIVTDEESVKKKKPVDDVPIPDDVHISDTEDTDAADLPKIKTKPYWLKPANALADSYQDPKENKLLWKISDVGSFIKWYYKQIGKKKLSKADLECLAFKVNLANTEGNRVVPDVSKPLPLGGPPGQVTIQPQYFFNKDLEYLVSCDKERMNALSISKLKAAYYPDFRLEELIPSLWIESEREYNISAAYGNLNHLSGADKVHLFNAVNLWIRNIVIRKHIEDLQLRIESYQMKLNLTLLFKEDYTIVHKPRAVIYRDRNNKKKMMMESEVHKFSDGTLTRILEKMDYMVKDFVLFKFNPGMENRIWSRDDKMRSKEFIEVIERRLKIRRILRSLESFVSGRLRDVDYRFIQRTE